MEGAPETELARKGAIVGRSAELAQLEAGLEAAAAGRGRLHLVTGEGGIGKTHLVTELSRRALDRGFTIAWGRCAEVGGAPAFWPWIQILRSIRRARARNASSKDAGPLERLLPKLRGEDRGAAVVDPTQARLALFEEVVDALRDVADRDAPLALFFEDIHAADPSSLALVQFLARDLADAHIMAVATYRDQEVRAHADRGEAVQRIAREALYLPLRRLDANEVRALLEQHAGPVTQAVAERVLAMTEGNALFVVELARSLAAGESRSLPTGVRDAIAQRLSGLDAETREVLGAASVLGREFDPETLAAVLDRTPADLRPALARAEAAGVIAPPSRGMHVFSHVLVRDVLHRELFPRRRAELHAKLADVLAASKTAAPERTAAAIAAHLLEAVDVVGPERAFRASLDAARHAAEAFAFEDVIAIVGRANATVGPALTDRRLRAEGLVLAGEAHMRTGADAEGRAASVEAAAIAKSLGDGALLARAALACGAEIAVGHVDGTLLKLLGDALELLPESEIALRAQVLARLAGAEQPSDDPSQPMGRAREAIALARRSADRRTLRMALHYGGSALVDYADPNERMALSKEMHDLAVETGDLLSAFRAQHRLFFDHVELGDRPGAVACAGEMQRIADTMGWSRMQATSALARACLAATRGALLEAVELLELSQSFGTTPGARTETELLFRIGLAFLVDHAEEVEPLAVELRERWQKTASPLAMQWASMMVAVARARLGDAEGARAAIASIPRDGASFRYEPLMVSLGAELATLLGDEAWAAELLPSTLGLSSRFASWGQQAMLVFHPFMASVGQLQALLGRWDEAFASFAESEKRASEAGALPAMAWTLYWHASARARSGDRERAKELAQRAKAICKELGIDGLVTRIDALDTGEPRRSEARAPEKPATPAAPPGKGMPLALSLDGEVWTIKTAGKELRLKDSRGMRMLARLLEEPGREMHVMMLAAEGVDPGDLGSAGEVIDAAAIKSYRGRIEDLRDAIAEAERFGDAARADGHRAELDFLLRELAAGVGLGGRSRKAAAVAERARVNVQRRLKDAIRRIGEQSPELGEYLGWTIRTGTFCSYRPPGTGMA